MSAVRDSNNTRYVFINSERDRSDGNLSNFTVPISRDSTFQKVKGVQLLNTQFVPVYQNIRPDTPGGSVANFRWLEQNSWSMDPTADAFTSWSFRLIIHQTSPPLTNTANVSMVKTPGPVANRQENFADTTLSTSLATRINGALLALGFTIRVGMTILPQDDSTHRWNLFLQPGTATAGDSVKMSAIGPFLGSSALHVASANFLGTVVGEPNSYWEWLHGQVTASLIPRSVVDNLASVRIAIPAGTYTKVALIAALNAGIQTPVVIARFNPNLIVFSDDPAFPNYVRITNAVSPEGDVHKSGIRLFRDGGYDDDSRLQYLLGFEEKDDAFTTYRRIQTAQQDTALHGEMRAHIHVKPVNQQGGIVGDDGDPRRISAWGAIPLSGSGIPVFYDFSFSGDAAYFQGFADGRDCTVLDIALRYPDGREVEVVSPGVFLALKFIYDQ